MPVPHRTIPYKFNEVASRLSIARNRASAITTGNRCAMVLGIALNLRPHGTQESMFGQSFVSDEWRSRPEARQFFVKAWDLAESVMAAWGPPRRVPGPVAAQQLAGQHGFVFLEDCWKTPGEKFNRAVFDVDVQTGDHADLWDGQVLAIYPRRGDSLALLGQARTVWFWPFATA